MATKLELETDRQRYLGLIHEANQALAGGNDRLAINKAVESLEYWESAVQYEKRYERNELFPSVACMIISRTAPALFAFKALDTLESKLNDSRILDKSGSHRDGISAARDRMRGAAQLWDLIRTGSATPEQLRSGADFIEKWKRLGCLFKGSAKLQFAFQPDTPMRAKCRYCGAVSHGKKLTLLNAQTCPKCSATSELVLLGTSDKG